MFQSSRMACGSARRHNCSACSPSSASETSNSSPSKIRRATLRMTLESSTIMQVFISFASLCPRPPEPPDCKLVECSCRPGRTLEIEHPVDIQDDQQSAFE